MKEKSPPPTGGGGGTPTAALSAGAPVAATAAVPGPVQGGCVEMLAPDQLAKLKRELEIVETNMTVFGEMLTEMNPQAEHQADYQLLTVILNSFSIDRFHFTLMLCDLSLDKLSIVLLNF